jgi:acylphosphatase
MPSPATSVRGSKEKIRAHLFILGKVQGVYFRHNTRIIANRFGVKGWVRNLEDGQVEAVLEGDEINVNALAQASRVRELIPGGSNGMTRCGSSSAFWLYASKPVGGEDR